MKKEKNIKQQRYVDESPKEEFEPLKNATVNDEPPEEIIEPPKTFLLLDSENEIIGIVDSMVEDEICVEVESSEVDFTALGKLFIDGKVVEKEKTPEELKEQAQKALINLCDKKQDAIKTMILGYKNTPKQQERYDNKYQRALKVKADNEANTTPTETNQEILTNYQTIIAKYEYVKKQIEKFIDLIEDFRTKVDDMIESGEIDKANELIALAQNFNADTSQDDIDKLFL